MTLVIAVDIGATRTRVALVESGRIIAKVEGKTPRKGSSTIISEKVVELIKELGDKAAKATRIGVGSIGPLDLSRGLIVGAPNIEIPVVKLVEPLMEATGKPVILANDCMAAVWGEYLYGRWRGTENIVYVTISTGIGGGMIVDGHLLVGKKGNAHEIGHITVDVMGRMPCKCGGRGHWEAYSSGDNIPRFAKHLIAGMEKHAAKSSLDAEFVEKVYRGISAREVFEYARRGSKLAQMVVEEVNRINMAGIEAVVNLYDPEVVVLGGSVVLNNVDLVFNPLREALQSWRGLVTDAPRLELASFGDDEVLVGAAAIAENPPPELIKRLSYLTSL